jgi:hypothetical protein
MPLFTDVHHALPAGTTAADLARAQRADLKVQAAHGVSGEPLNISARHIASLTRLAPPVTGP